MKFVVAPLLVVAMGNSLSDVAAETAANASFPLADVTTLDAPLALRITGSGAADGRYLLREGVPVAGLRCAKRDGVYWENEANAYVLEARDGSATKWSIANATDAAADAWLYGSDSAGQKIHPLGGEDEHPVYPSLERVRRRRGPDLGTATGIRG
ncbi:hypothetical protein JL720_2823 [Aureococcus anophagefferens]|nr:hypothetical protein JL720_2823 [Aureococcus anophagefferens]